MSMELLHDPRNALVRTKYFSLHPKPLERWLWRQGLPQAAERVFWLHWEEGMRAGDWSSEIPIKRVARECSIDPSTVTRAYQLLKSLGLLKREDPGRDPNNPFCQATAITEVRLPRELVAELSKAPNRPASGRAGAPAPAAVTETPAAAPAVAAQVVAAAAIGTPDAARRPTRAEASALWGRASAGERARFFAASRDRLTAFEFDRNTRLTPEDRGHILEQLVQLAAAKPTLERATGSHSLTNGKPSNVYAEPRKLSPLELARARKRILESVPADGAAEVFRQVIWAVEEGALRRFTPVMALNIALKKIREGAWNTPNRMPPLWLPRVLPVTSAVPEHCSAA